MKDANGQELQIGDLVVHRNYWDGYNDFSGDFTLSVFRILSHNESRVEVVGVLGKLRNSKTQEESGEIELVCCYKYPASLPVTRENVIVYRRLLGLQV